MRSLLTSLVLVCAVLAAPDPAALKIQGPDTLGTPIPVVAVGPGTGGSNQTAVSGSNTGAAAAITANLGNSAGKTTYITGFQVTGAGATGASVITVTVTGTISATQSYNIAVPAGAAVGVTPLIVQFVPPLPASGQAVSIVVNVPSFGAGNTNAAVAAQGFYQ